MAEIQSLARGLKILDILGQAQDGVSITELANTLGVDKGSASRLMSTLVCHGYAEKDETTRRFHLGSQVVTLSRSVLTHRPLREAAKPYLHQLMERTGECAHLAIPAQGKVLYIDQVESPATLRVNAQVGTMNPLHCTALGKALLAFGDLELPSDLTSFTPRTITDPEMLRRHLNEVRQHGYAVDDEEFDIGVRCIAVPVFDFRGKAVGAIGISGPATRMTPERLPALAEIVVEIGKTLSERLTFTR
ncbi:MAG: IclR family transcriptional regulator [Anaerolineaceae bacterium]|jgi:DNA-binding IclR family transcriptional regulator